jgi:peptidoglycan/xylan/chitin deacetylase (PgdA/CDA1 family)
MDKKELDEEVLQRNREAKQRIEAKKKRRQREMFLHAVGCLAVLAVIVGITNLTTSLLGLKEEKKKVETETVEMETMEPETEDPNSLALAEAELLAAGYDYDGAIERVKQVSGYEQDESLTAAVTKYAAAKDSCVAVDVDSVPQIYVHSLINDTSLALDTTVVGEDVASRANAWTLTVDEFEKILDAMYNNGYVFVSMKDLVIESTDESGNVTFTRNEELMLPAGKKAIVLSVDDVNYYHTYEGAGYADKLVLDNDGKVKAQYTNASGSASVGDYDVIPIVDSFIEAHPDASYHGARGTIALTGYEGVFGYRTDTAYETGENLSEEQSAWLSANTGFNWDSEVRNAKKVAEALKEDGWEFANHTWGHINVSDATVDDLQSDNEKWLNTVANIVGETDIVIFSRSGDIGDWHDYSTDNAKFNFYKSAGYNYFCCVDASVPYWIQIRENYIRQARIDLDGYTLYQASQGYLTSRDDLFSAGEILDSTRTTPISAVSSY